MVLLFSIYLVLMILLMKLNFFPLHVSDCHGISVLHSYRTAPLCAHFHLAGPNFSSSPL